MLGDVFYWYAQLDILIKLHWWQIYIINHKKNRAVLIKGASTKIFNHTKRALTKDFYYT